MNLSNKPSCPECGSNNVYVRVSSGELVCRRCGCVESIGDSEKEEEREKKKETETHIAKAKGEEKTPNQEDEFKEIKKLLQD